MPRGLTIAAVAVSGVVLVGALGFLALAWESELDPVPRPDPQSFDPQLVARGEQLARVGNCVVCHTAGDGEPFAGGVGVETPFGTIYSTNITPDPETGIGDWSEAAFHRAMHEGVDRQGRHLYPAFPYDHFTIVSREDNRALYAYLMTREPVRAEPPANELPFPLDNRMLLAGWKLLYFTPGEFVPEPNQTEAWNRGAYLAEGLAHCGACHTPRNALGALDRDRHFDGAELDGWHAYPINENSYSPIPWDVEALTFYLQNGWHEHHGVSRGTMAPVTANLGGVAREEVEALATYVVSGMGTRDAEAYERARAVIDMAGGQRRGPMQAADSLIAPPQGAELGEAIFASACATCHEAGRPLPQGGLDLHLSTAMHAEHPQNIINVTLFGLPAADGAPSGIMPGFSGALSEDQMVALLDYMRARFGGLEPWEDARERVRSTMSGETSVVIYRSHGMQAAPPATQLRANPWQ